MDVESGMVLLERKFSLSNGERTTTRELVHPSVCNALIRLPVEVPRRVHQYVRYFESTPCTSTLDIVHDILQVRNPTGLSVRTTRGRQPGEHGGGVGAGRGDRKFTPPPNVVRPSYRTFTWSHFVRGVEDRNQPNARSLHGRTLQSSPKSKVGLRRERWATSHVTQRSCTLGPGAIGQQRTLVFVLSTQNKVRFLK
jgi:hypothetical protein